MNPRWTAARVAHPVADLERSAAFYGELLGLPRRGGFTGHDGYDGVFFALPGGTELELTAGPARPRPGTEEDLLVLYLGTPDAVREAAAPANPPAAIRMVPAGSIWMPLKFALILARNGSKSSMKPGGSIAITSTIRTCMAPIGPP